MERITQEELINIDEYVTQFEQNGRATSVWQLRKLLDEVKRLTVTVKAFVPMSRPETK